MHPERTRLNPVRRRKSRFLASNCAMASTRTVLIRRNDWCAFRRTFVVTSARDDGHLGQKGRRSQRCYAGYDECIPRGRSVMPVRDRAVAAVGDKVFIVHIPPPLQPVLRRSSTFQWPILGVSNRSVSRTTSKSTCMHSRASRSCTV